MIQLIISILIGIIATEFLYFKVIRKRLVQYTHLDGLEYTFSNFIFEKGLAMFGGLLSAIAIYGLIRNYRETARVFILMLSVLDRTLIIAMLLTIFIIINWKISCKLEKKE